MAYSFPRFSMVAALAAAFSLALLSGAGADGHFVPVSAPKTVAMGETIYVPIYSHVYIASKARRLLAATLNIHNIDPHNAIVVTSVRYYDTMGKPVQTYLDRPHRLAPLATTEFVIDRIDQRGGSGANFIVEWVADKRGARPIVEAVMVGVSGPQGLSFIREGRVIATKP